MSQLLIVGADRPCGNCGHRDPHENECEGCECPTFDFGMTTAERDRGDCRWCDQPSHEGTCESAAAWAEGE